MGRVRGAAVLTAAAAVLGLTASLMAPAGAAPPPGGPDLELLAETYALLDGASDPATGRARALDDGDDFAVCGSFRVVAETVGTGAGTEVLLTGGDVRFAVGAVPDSWWRHPPSTSPVWLLQFLSLAWMSTVAVRAHDTGDAEALDALVVTATRFLADNPDQGTSAYGWDEGTNLRRQQALNCLYRVTDGDERIVPLMEETARANLDMSRYYGMPRFPAHNHGLMANLALLDAAELLDRPAWADTAIERMLRDAPTAFTPGGLSIEQSSSYTVMNRKIWENALGVLRSYRPDEPAAALERAIALAHVAAVHLTDPSGMLVPYGDANPERHPLEQRSSAGFRDDVAGVVAGRWSWTDPSTSYYMLRYGPPRRMHGHEDRGSLVWYARGVPVLVDPGRYSYDPVPLHTFQSAPVGHNAFIVRGRTFNPRAGVKLTKRTSSGTAHGLQLTDAQYGVAHRRSWIVDHARAQVVLTDAVAAKGTTTLHLAPGWVLRSVAPKQRLLVFGHPSGVRLRVSATHPMRVYTGSSSPLLGWTFPAYGQAVAAPQIVMHTLPGTSQVTLTLF